MIIQLLLAVYSVTQGAQLAACPTAADPARLIDTTFVQRADLDGDAIPDELRLRLRARKLDEPFSLEFTVISKGNVLLRRSTVDTKLDSTFKAETFDLPCNGYLQCKCEWYYNRILLRAIQPGSALGNGVFDATAPNSIQHVARSHLVRSCGATPATAEESIRKAILRLRSANAPFLTLPVSPAQSESPIFWFPEFACFAPVYRE